MADEHEPIILVTIQKKGKKERRFQFATEIITSQSACKIRSANKQENRHL